MCPPTVWIISGMWSRRKKDTNPAPELFFSWTWLQLRSSWFSSKSSNCQIIQLPNHPTDETSHDSTECDGCEKSLCEAGSYT